MPITEVDVDTSFWDTVYRGLGRDDMISYESGARADIGRFHSNACHTNAVSGHMHLRQNMTVVA
jgi:hypothetical protein